MEDTINIDLSGVYTRQELILRIFQAFHGEAREITDWQELAGIMAGKLAQTHIVCLSGLDHLERVLPDDMNFLFEIFSEHNNNFPDSVCSLRAADDYEPVTYFLQFVAQRSSSNKAMTQFAYVNCWVKISDLEDAKIIAEEAIQDASWDVTSLEECHLVNRSDYSSEDTSLGYLLQAYIDGVVLVFHSWEE